MPGDARDVADRPLQARAKKPKYADRNGTDQHKARRVAESDEPRLQKPRKKRRRSVHHRIYEAADGIKAKARRVDHEIGNADDKQAGKHGQEVEDAAKPDPVPDIILNPRPVMPLIDLRPLQGYRTALA